MSNENEFTKVIAELSSNYIHFKLENNEIESRPPQDIIAVVDTSGSMSNTAKIKTETGIVEVGLSVLDIVKHSLKTIVSSLKPKDRFSLVIYSFEGKVVIPLGNVTEEFKEDAIDKINHLTADGLTNLWDGLLKGMNELKINTQGHNQSILLLTDGLPNVNPPRGHIETYKRYLEKNPSKFSLYTCGFGYNMDSELLFNLSKETPTGGNYNFIPDSGMVGTIFINLMANIFSQSCNNIKLEIPKELDDFIEDKLDFGNMNQYSQSIIVKLKKSLPDGVEFKITGNNLYYGPFKLIVKPSVIKDIEDFNFHKIRYHFCKDLISSIKSKSFNFKVFEKVLKETDNNNKIKKLLEDYQGQVKEAFETKYFDKWGKHYLPSLLMAHEQCKCNNFKDPGVQNYSDSNFEKYQEEMEEIFTKLPPPTPSKKVLPKDFSMNTYYSSNNPCYSPECMTMLENGKKISVGDLKKGMIVKTPKGPAQVRLVIVSKVKNHETLMCHFDKGLKITPYHPIIYQSKWTYPCKVIEPIPTRTPVVVSVVLNKYHILTINQIDTITMGHDIKDPIVAHPFFGSDKVIKELSKHPTFDSGEVILPENSIKRDSNTNMVIGFNLF